jgi:hypothetical protein
MHYHLHYETFEKNVVYGPIFCIGMLIMTYETFLGHDPLRLFCDVIVKSINQWHLLRLPSVQAILGYALT